MWSASHAPDEDDDDELLFGGMWTDPVMVKVITMPKQPHAFGLMVPLAYSFATTTAARYRYIVKAEYIITALGTSLSRVLEDFWYTIHEDFTVTATDGYTPVVELGRIEGFLVPPFRDDPLG